MLATVHLFGGLMSGSGLLLSYRCMGSVARGKTDFIALKQSALIFESAMSVINLLIDMEITNTSTTRRKWIARLIAYPLPFALQILNHHVDTAKHPYVKRSLLFARNHIEHVAFAVDVCSTLAFTYYVAPKYGIGMLIGLSIELLNENKVFSAKVKEVWEKVWICLAFTQVLKVAVIKNVDRWEVAKLFGEISVFTWENYFAKSPPSRLNEHLFNPDQPQKLLEKPLNKFSVNWSHVQLDPELVIPGADKLSIVDTAKTLIEKVSWTPQNLKLFKEKLLGDLRFANHHPSKQKIEDISDEFAKEYFKDGLTVEAAQISTSSFQSGDAYIKYDNLQGMMKSIFKVIKEQLDNPEHTMEAMDDLFRLALEGGEYCAAGHVQVIEDIYKSRILRGKDIPLKVKVLHMLTAKRQHWFDGAYAQVAQYLYRLPKGIIDPSDIHFRNVTMFYFDKGLKLHSKVLKNDMTPMEGGFCSGLYRLIFSECLDYTFWAYAIRSKALYSTEAIHEEMETISSEDFTKFWLEWINKTYANNETRRQELEDEITLSGTLFNETLQVEKIIEVGNRKIKRQVVNPNLLKLMLYDMNIII